MPDVIRHSRYFFLQDGRCPIAGGYDVRRRIGSEGPFERCGQPFVELVKHRFAGQDEALVHLQFHTEVFFAEAPAQGGGKAIGHPFVGGIAPQAQRGVEQGQLCIQCRQKAFSAGLPGS